MTITTTKAADFAALGVSPGLTEVLRRRGITEPFPIQTLTLPDALAGRDVCGQAKTGSGKTLAFGLALVQRIGRSELRRPSALVLVPTRELALQVAEELRPLGEAVGLRVRPVYGGAPIGSQKKQLQRGVDVVVATPGRLIDLYERRAVDLSDVRALVIDEADRMSDMGFLPQVKWLLRKMPEDRQTMLYSATLDWTVEKVVRHHMSDPVRHEVISDRITVDEMEHRFFLVHQMDKAQVAASIARAAGKTLVFTRTKRGADRLVRALREAGIDAGAIHGDLPQRDRERRLGRFASGEMPVLVGTNLAGRGLHIEEIDLVLHYDPPEDHKSYLHRSGRTARAGAAGMVATLVLWDQEREVKELQDLVELNQPIIKVFSNDPRLADLASFAPGPS
ncbi:MAG: DEAD/DEAH box helicase [Acidimicrobiia bacterium]